MIPVYKPYLPPDSLKWAHDALDSTWLSCHGKYIQIAQEKLQELLSVKYVIPLNNGTSACHLVAKALKTKHQKSRVIVPNNVYVAAWNAFLFDGNYEIFAIEPDLNTWNFDLDELDKSIRMRPDAAVLVVHNIGNIINVPELQKKYPNTVFVEDNCEGFLGKYDGVYSGTTSYASAISFFGNKNITSGEGGAFITNDEETYLFAKCVQGQGQSEQKFVHKELGYNYRMTNIQAAILCGQLDILPQILEMKERVFYDYRVSFQNREDILFQVPPPNTQHSNWLFGVRVPGNKSYEQTELFFKNSGIEIRPMFYPIEAHQYLADNYTVSWSSCEKAKLLQQECFILPSYPELSVIDQGYIVDTVNHYVRGK